MKRWGIIGALAATFLCGTIAPPLLAAGSTTPMICYSDSGSTGIKYRFYESGTWSNEYTGESIWNGTPWVVTRWCPTREEYTCATIDWSQRVHVRIWQSGSWLSPMLVANSCGTTVTRPIDAAYEQVSGDGLVVYWSTTSPACLHYRTFDGTTLSSDQTLTLPGTQRVTWARLYPKAGTDLILLLALNEGRDLYAAFWTGSGWSSVETLDTNTNSSDSECFDAAYEGVSGDLLVTYTSSGSNKPKYRTFNGSSWSGGDYLPSVGSPQRWLRMTADPVSDQILFACSDSSKDLNVCTWNGSSWGSVDEFSGETLWDQMRAFDISYAAGGTKAMIVYSRDWLTVPRYRIWSGSSWSGESSTPSLGDYMTLPTLIARLHLWPDHLDHPRQWRRPQLHSVGRKTRVPSHPIRS